MGLGGTLETMDKTPEQNLVFKVRFEYEIPVKTGGLFGRRKDFKQEAEAIREKKINILEKVPVKGIRILEIDPHHEIYIKDEEGGKTACAPVEILFEAETLEDAIPFLLSKDFCGVILQYPGRINLSQHEFERVIERISRELQNQKAPLRIRYGIPEPSYLLQELPAKGVPTEGTAEDTPEETEGETTVETGEITGAGEAELPGQGVLPVVGGLPGQGGLTKEVELPSQDGLHEEVPEEADLPDQDSLPEEAPEETELPEQSELPQEVDLAGQDVLPKKAPEETELPDQGDLSEEVELPDQGGLPEEAPEKADLPAVAASVKKVLRIEWDLEIIAVLSLILAGVIAFDGEGWLHYVRIGLGLPFVLFFPGYVLIAALFPKKDDLGGIERLALSFGLSIAVVPLIGLGLNYTPWGIRLTPILLSLIFFIIIMGCISFFRRDKLPPEERYCPTFQFEFPVWKEQPLFDRVLSIALIVAILFAIGSIFYVVSMPKVGEQFTEFYILGMNGKAEGYPRELAVGEEGEVIVGVVNHEYQQEKYFVEVKMDDLVLPREGPIVLEHEEKWENPLSFYYPEEYENLKVEFLLYREGDDQPYRSLHLWVNIQGQRDNHGENAEY